MIIQSINLTGVLIRGNVDTLRHTLGGAYAQKK